MRMHRWVRGRSEPSPENDDGPIHGIDLSWRAALSICCRWATNLERVTRRAYHRVHLANVTPNAFSVSVVRRPDEGNP